MDLNATRPDAPQLQSRRPFQRLLAEATAEIGARLELESQFGHLGRVIRTDGTRLPVFGNALGVNRDAAAALAADKDYTARFLAQAGLPTPPGLLIFGPAYAAQMALKNAAVAAQLPDAAAACAWAEAQGWPVIAKPNGGSEGRGISRAENADALQSDLRALFATDQKVRIEAFWPGADHRVVVWNGAVHLAYQRSPAHVTGDGQTPLGDLLHAMQTRLTQTDRGPKLDLLSPALTRWRTTQNLTLDSIPAKDQIIPILPQANLSLGGTCTDITETLSPQAADLACRATAELGLRLAGVDILAPDLTTGIHDATILEVNSAPGFDGYATTTPQAWARAKTLLQDILTQG